MKTDLEEIKGLIQECDYNSKINIELISRLRQEKEIFRIVIKQNTEEIRKIDNYIKENTNTTITINFAISSGGLVQIMKLREVPLSFWNFFSDIAIIKCGEKQIIDTTEANKFKKNLLTLIEGEEDKIIENDILSKRINEDNLGIAKKKEVLLNKKQSIPYSDNWEIVKERTMNEKRSSDKLIKAYIRVCMELNQDKLPTVRSLEKLTGISKSEWDRTLSEVAFLYRLRESIYKKIKNQKLCKDKRENLCKIVAEVEDRYEKFRQKEIKKKRKSLRD